MALVLAGVLSLAIVAVQEARAHVYWASSGNNTVGRANLDGTAVNPNLITGVGNATAIAVDGAHVYWASGLTHTIGRANLDGTGASQSFITGANDPRAVAVDGAHIYWTNNGTNRIGRANLDGTGVDQSFITLGGSIAALAVDGAHLYWTNYSTNRIGRANLDGTGVDQSFITTGDGPHGVAVGGAHVYWTNGASGTIGRAELDGSSVNQSLISGANTPYGVAVDGAHLYWANAGHITIGRSNLDGTDANSSFITTVGPFGVAVSPLQTSITQGPADMASSRSATFSFRSSEPAGFDCRLDTQPFAACGSPKTYSALANGRHTFQVRARDAAGNVDPTPATRSWSVNATASVSADTTAPVLSALKLSRSVFAAARSGPSIKAKRRTDTKIGYRLTERASVRFQILRRSAGRAVNGRCRPLTRANRRRRKCDLPLKGILEHHGVRGTNSLRFRGRLRGRKLKPARYLLVATATDAANNQSRRNRARFRIVTR